MSESTSNKPTSETTEQLIARITNERDHLQKQVTELQEKCTEQLFELREVDKFGALNSLAKQVFEAAREKGWHPDDYADTQEKIDDYMPRACANITGEVSELWEAYRRAKLNEWCDKNINLTCLEEECADIVIRALDTAAKLSVNIGNAVEAKLAYNATRPFRHGNRRA